MSAVIPYTVEEAMPFLQRFDPELVQDARWAAKKIGRGLSKAWKAHKRSKSRKKRKTSNKTFGEPMGYGETQRAITRNASIVPYSTRTLNSYDLVDIDPMVNHEVNRRHRDIIDLKGIKLAMYMKNTISEPLYFNVAVVVPKFNQSSTTVANSDFFRASTDQRGTSFSTNLSPLEFHSLPINSDLFHILLHRRFIVGGDDTAAGFTDSTKPNYLSFTKYLTVNRQIRFEDNNPVNGRIQLCYWADKIDSAPTFLPTTNAYQVSEHHICYYNNPK